jgi:amino-acid N-acetyltransferase
MKPMIPEKAKISDVKHMHKLINYYADRDEMLPRSLSEIYENIRDFFIIRKGNKVVACAALHVAWEDLAEIKSSAVDNKYMRQGLGALLVEACLNEAKELGIPTVFVLSYKPEFFKKCGFSRIDKNDLPQKVWGECFRCSKFPNCDETALIYRFEDKK